MNAEKLKVMKCKLREKNKNKKKIPYLSIMHNLLACDDKYTPVSNATKNSHSL